MNQKKGTLSELVDLFKKPLERLWNCVSKEQVKELKIESITTAFIKSLESKKFVVEKGKAKIPIKELEKEPKEMADQLSLILKEI